MTSDDPERLRWRQLSSAIAGQPLPLAVVDLDAVDRNIDRLVAPIAKAGKLLRVATKSLRCPALVDYIIARLGKNAGGLLTYTASETQFWAARGATDLLLGYPTLQPSDLALLGAAASAKVVVDAVEHLVALSALGERLGRTIGVVLDLDMSYRPLGDGGPHLGVRRSPLHGVADVVALARRARDLAGIEVVGLLGYEAQIAGLADGRGPARWGRRLFKRWSLPDVVGRRDDVVAAVRALGLRVPLVNGGGSGSVHASSLDPSLTEVSAGSGFLDSHLFDHYDGLPLEPAIYFALQTTRRPAPGTVTCLGGGFIASGGAGADRLPVPALPPGGRLLPLEGAGEVQTPVQFDPRRFAVDDELALGTPLFFRHAKAGELAEHFDHYLLLRGTSIVERAPTYRGLGHCFLG